MPRRVWLALGVLTVWGAWTYVFPPTPRLAPLTRLEMQAGPTVVLVPHPDDEALATGGLIQQLQDRGIPTTVILATAGDGFKEAAELRFRRVNLPPGQMVAFGRERLQESRTALQTLGLPPDKLIFLGFPDKGLDRLWKDCWSALQPCTSISTGATRVPYSEAYQPGAPYAGDELVKELTDLLRQLKPALVVYPHPNEAHVDHWGLSNFTQAALEQLRRTDPNWIPPAEWLYLVHRGDWPAPKGYRPYGGLLPPESLAGGMTIWRQEPLTPDEVDTKYKAVRAYATQVAMLRRYMESFVRTNELFGSIDRAYVVQPGQAIHSPGVHPGTSSPPWRESPWTQVITDPRADTMAREMERGADLLSVWAATDGTRLFLAAELAAKPARPSEARFNLRGFKSASGWSGLTSVTVLPDGSHRTDNWPAQLGREGVQSDAQGTWLRMSVPLDILGSPETMMINAETRANTIPIDRSAWRPISLDGR
jgi:LmbE family N-acetylglucosaminyl deacetylase